jgi:hypothetical protein
MKMDEHADVLTTELNELTVESVVSTEKDVDVSHVKV